MEDGKHEFGSQSHQARYGRRQIYGAGKKAAEVENLLIGVAAQYDNLLLDMGKLEYVSSAGLRAFKHVYMDLRRKGGVLKARNASKSVMEVLELTGFTRLFKFL